ncbi:hypothetical protein CMU94_02270 [Elizabethkingia anophelis]|nr:hypothetical protein [Elizabethkingia anophelis]
MKEEKIIMYDSPEAAIYRKNIEGWVSSNGRFFGNVKEDFLFSVKNFKINTMTLGYPKSGDKERTLKLEHLGIEIRTGNPEWGAESGKLYFVIKHGKILDV